MPILLEGMLVLSLALVLRLLSLLLSLFLLLLLPLLLLVVIVVDVVVNIAVDAKILIAKLDAVGLVLGVVVVVGGGKKVDSLQTVLESRRTKSKVRSGM